jgi:hypothetical protein
MSGKSAVAPQVGYSPYLIHITGNFSTQNNRVTNNHHIKIANIKKLLTKKAIVIAYFPHFAS